MALKETTNNVEKKPMETTKSTERKEKPLTKVIIRRLPPDIDKDTFLNQVSPVPEYNYMYLVNGDRSLKENAFARVYINFICPEDVYNFKERFDNYVFLDNKGQEYPAVVEFASFQKIPKKRGKVRVDPKSGSIESDPLYQEFVESLNKPPEQDEKPEYSLQLTTDNKNDITTPLLEYIKNKRAQRNRIREARREERKKRELDRKKREDERRKAYQEKSPVKPVVKPASSKLNSPKEEIDDAEIEDQENEDEKAQTLESKSEKSFEKHSTLYKGKEKKFEDRRRDTKPKYLQKKEYIEKREYKRSEDHRDFKDRDYKEKEYKSKYDEYKKENDPKMFPKKVKKYSEKREERKIEAQKAEQKKLEQQTKDPKASDDTKSEPAEKAKSTSPEAEEKPQGDASEAGGGDTLVTDKVMNRESKSQDSDTLQKQKRIRNKDRPTLAIYRPGMLSKRKQTDGDTENKDAKN